MKATILRKVKKGDVFKFRPTEKANVWVRDDYDRETKSLVIMTTLISVVGTKEKEIV